MILRLRLHYWILALCLSGPAQLAAQDNPAVAHRYVLTMGLDLLESDVELPAGATAEFSTDRDFIPEPLPGFGAAYGNIRVVSIGESGQSTHDSEDGDTDHSFRVAAGDWVGVRNRFRTGLIRASAPLVVDVKMDAVNQPRLLITSADPDPDHSLSFTVYAGPIEYQALRAIDPQLIGMLFAALWDWLRAICFGMLWLLSRLDSLVGNIGVAVILLSLSVKVLMSPLTHVADRLQDSVNRTQALLQPQLDAIKRDYKGEDAHNRTLAVYKQHGVHPLYTLKSLVGFMIQIPIFIAAFDMLGENVALNQASFLWIADLAKPDRWLVMPIVVPFFGGHLNLLPILMTGVTVLTSWIQTDPSLTPELLHRQRQRLYLMAGAFFLLFYTFPAGMVLYWTTNNVLHLIKIKLLPAKK